MNIPPVYIIIVNYQRWMDTLDCIDSLLNSTWPEFSVCIVDNASGNDSLKQIEDHIHRLSLTTNSIQVQHYKQPGLFTGAAIDRAGSGRMIHLIQNDRNSGFAAANNLVLEKLYNEDILVWLLNPDMTVEKNTLEQLVQFYLQQPGDTVAGTIVKSGGDNPAILFYGGGKVHAFTATIQPVVTVHETPDYISGASLFTRTRVFRENGLLPEDYFLYWEETDWCRAVKENGVALRVCPDAVCYDKVSTVIGRGFLADYYYTRNGLFFVKKFAPLRLPVALFFVVIRWCKRILTGNNARARGVFRGLIDFIKKKTHALT